MTIRSALAAERTPSRLPSTIERVRGTAFLTAVLVAAAASTAAAVPGGAPEPRLTLVAQKPVVVRGDHFRRFERVLVRFAADARLHADPPDWRYRRATADATGRFLVRYEPLRVGRCSTYEVRARGHFGTTSRLRREVSGCRSGVGAGPAAPSR